jgi:mono/diheme cytochrome c family protein
MNRELFKRLTILVGVVLLLFGFIELFAFDVVKLDWVSFMEIQPAYQPMYDPLPVPANSIPVEGVNYLSALGSNNPVAADAVSLTRGQELYRLNCRMCHGDLGKGDGPISIYIKNKPADLTGIKVQSLTDAGIFLTISNGVAGKMPALNENLLVRERWDVVNYVRTLK